MKYWLLLLVSILHSGLSFSGDEVKSNPVLSNDLLWQRTIIEAKASIGSFRDLLSKPELASSLALVKVYFPEQGAYLWFMVVDVDSKSFVVQAFEALPQLDHIVVGEAYSVSDEYIVDWSLNNSGSMYGGFSMRYIRDQKTKDEQDKYDQYVGVKEWMPLP
ncbi:DUF2314 domain-containing protein [Vibrio harveyi]|uniref:DUF2314 domain-containing protein n=1 Tax=Vibrio harveyi TaxID=669 RepID=UPI00390B4F56